MPIFKSRKARWALLIVGVLLLLVIGGLALAVYNIEGLIHSRKDQILSQVGQAIGRPVSADDLHVSIWSGLGVELTEFTIADDPAFSDRPFLETDELNVQLQWRPLLRGDVQISNFHFQEPKIHLIRNAQGVMNTTSLGGSTAPEGNLESNPAGNAEQAGSSTGSSSSVKVSVQSFRIENGQVVYDDRAANQSYTVQAIDLNVDDFSMDQPFPVRLSAAMFSDRPNLHFDGRMGPIAEMRIDGNLRVETTSLQPLLQAEALKGGMPAELRLEGNFRGNSSVQGTPSQLALKPEIDMSQALIAYSDQFVKAKGAPLILKGDVLYTPQEVSFPSLTIDMKPSAMLTGSGTIGLANGAGVKMDLQSQPVDLATLEKMVPAMDVYDPQGSAQFDLTYDSAGKTSVNGKAVMQNASLQVDALPKRVEQINGTISFNNNSASTKDLSLKTGQTELAVNADIPRYDPLQMDYTLRSDALAVADVVETEAQDNNDVLRQVEASGRLNLPPDGVQANGKLNSGAGTLYGLEYKNLNGNYQLAKQVFTAPQVNLQTLNGNLEANATYDMSQEPPSFAVSTQAKQIDLVEMFRQKAFNLPQFVNGRIDFALDLSGAGSEWEAIQKTLQGKGQAVVLDGMLLNVNLADSLLGDLARMPMLANFTGDLQKQYPALFQSEHTVFDKFEVKAGIQGSRIQLEPVMLAAAEWFVRGEGVYDMNQGLQSDALLQLSQGLSDFLLARVKELKFLTDREGKVVIPFSVQGALNNLQAAPNQDLVGNLLKNAVAGKALEAITGREGSPFADLLKGFPGQPKATQGKAAEPAGDTPAEPKIVPPALPSFENPLDALMPKSATSATAAEVQSATPAPKPKPEEQVKEAVGGLLKGIFGGNK